MSEVARLTKVLTGRGKHRGNIMPTKDVDGKPLTESKQLLDAWQEFLGRKFTCADIPGAAYAPVTAYDDNDGDVTQEELETCLRVLHDNKAPGYDGIPIEAYRGSPAAKQELFAIVRLIWQTEVSVLLLRLLMDAVLRAGKEAVVTFIDYRAAFDTISHRFLDESLAAAGVQPKIRRIVKAIYTEATGMVRLRLPSGETMCSEPFPVRRGVIQGDIFSQQCFTLGLDRIFRLHDIAGQGIGGPSLGEASERVSALASGSRASASMEMSAPSRRACMCTSGNAYQCRRKWRLRPLTSHTATPNARGLFQRHADWRFTELAGAARDSALPPDGASPLTKPSS